MELISLPSATLVMSQKEAVDVFDEVVGVAAGRLDRALAIAAVDTPKDLFEARRNHDSPPHKASAATSRD